MSHATRIRLCMKDLYHMDVVEMIERETRPYEIFSIEHPDHPLFPEAFRLLWETFGHHGEMEPEAVIRSWLVEDSFVPIANGTFMKYFIIVAKDRDGRVRGVRDGTILLNQAHANDLCVVYLSHIYMLPDARGTVLSYWLRIAPVEIAVQFMSELHSRGLIRLPQPDKPSRHFGMRVNLTAEMEFFAPEDVTSLRRILFYGRGGFDVIDPRHFPYRQPDFRDPEEITLTGVRELPFMILLRRMGREREAILSIDEAAATMKLLYDDFSTFCQPEHLSSAMDWVMDRLERRRASGKGNVRLLPLPTGPKDLNRLKRIWRYQAYLRHYPRIPAVEEYLASGIKEVVASRPSWLDDQLLHIARTLEARPHFVYANRDKDMTWEDSPMPPDPMAEPDFGEPEDTADVGMMLGGQES